MKALQTSVLFLTLGLLVSLWGTTFAQEEVPQDTVVVAEVDEFTALIQKSETLHDQKKYNETFEVLKEAEKLNPDDPELLWRLARAHFDIADQSDDEAVHKEHFYPGLDYAKRAVKLDPNSAKAHKWYAILIGKIGLMEGTKQKIINSYDVREHALKSIELDPHDDGIIHTMGRWHYTLADLSWIERTIANIIYHKVPQASFEEARDYFIKASKEKPDDPRHFLWLGKTYIELDDEELAKKAFRQCLDIQATDESDRLQQKEARELLEELE